jgi:hypothetical protein
MNARKAFYATEPGRARDLLTVLCHISERDKSDRFEITLVELSVRSDLATKNVRSRRQVTLA